MPKLLRLLDQAGVKASFYFSLGPDNTGRAVFRVFKRKGFLKKMQRTSALRVRSVPTSGAGMTSPTPIAALQSPTYSSAP